MVAHSVSWIASNLHLIGWPVICGLAWKAKGAIDGYFNEAKVAQDKIDAIVKVTSETKTNIDQLISNHLQHIAQGIEKLDETQKQSILVLTSIDKGIGILVDRK